MKVAISEAAVAAAPDLFGRDVSRSGNYTDFCHPTDRKEGELTTGELQMGSSKQVNRAIVYANYSVLKMIRGRSLIIFPDIWGIFLETRGTKRESTASLRPCLLQAKSMIFERLQV